jgi:hypothetical protein
VSERYFIGEDPDFGACHYLVPVSRRQDWDDWCGLPGDNPQCSTPPDFVKRVDYLEELTFAEPRGGA